MIALEIIGFLLLFILIIIFALVLVPITYHIEGSKYKSSFINADVSLLFGGVRFNFSKTSGYGSDSKITILGFKLKPKAGKVEKGSKKEKRSKKQKAKINYLRKDFLKRLLEAAGDLFNHIKPERFEVNGYFGLDEPFDTAMLWLIILGLPLHHRNFDISLHPVFDDEVLEGRFIIEGRIALAVILWIAARFRMSRPVKNILKERKRKVYAN